MISFRHHVVSLLAVLLALAAGIALGGGPLSEVGRTADADLRAENDELRTDLAAMQAETAFTESLSEGYSAQLTATKLADQKVAVVSLPGADGAVVDELGDLVTSAGGSVVGRFAIGDRAYRPAGKSLVDTLGAQLAETVADIPSSATTYLRLGQLLGRAVTGTGDADQATALTSSLVAAELLTADPESQAGATLVLVVLGDEERGSDTAALASLLTGIDAEAAGSVVVGSTRSAENGTLAALRGEQEFAAAVTTADSVQAGSGRVVAVLSLAAAAAGEQGHYGAEGADGATP